MEEGKFQRGMGIGGWLTNYKRFHVIPKEKINVLTVGDEEHFRTYIGEKDVAYIASLGFDHVRLCFDQIVMQTEEGKPREEHFALIDRFLEWSKKYGLGVVLNLHKAFGNYCDVDTGESLFETESLQEKFMAFWQDMAKRYLGEREVVFELLNEVKNIPPKEWNDLAKKTVGAIRKVDGSREIVIGTTDWNSPDKLREIEVLEDGNVAYTFHFYAPFEFTHQRGVLQTNTAFYNREMPYPDGIERYRDYQRCVVNAKNPYAAFSAMDARFISAALAPAAEFKKKNPEKKLWCGEFGTIRHCKLEWRINWMKDVISFLRKNGIPYCVWNYLSAPYDGNRFSLVDDETRKILSRELQKTLLGEF